MITRQIYIKIIPISKYLLTNYMDITFVTCFVHIYQEEPYQHKTHEWRLEHFKMIAATGVQICVYGCSETTPYLELCAQEYPNVRVLTMDIPYQETPIYKSCLGPELTLPERRNFKKDTVEYMALMNSKIEFVYDAIQKNPWNSRMFAWMDFSMAYIFNDKPNTLEYLKNFANSKFKETVMAVPGCWMPIPPNNSSAIINNIHWRFCGTFFMADKVSMLRFHQLYREHYDRFIEAEKKMVWEVNVWAWLEANTNWNPQWYDSDHNDRIIRIPECIYKDPDVVDESLTMSESLVSE